MRATADGLQCISVSTEIGVLKSKRVGRKAWKSDGVTVELRMLEVKSKLLSVAY